MKTHWKKLINPDYLGAYSLGDKTELIVTIEKVVREMITGTGGKKEECTVAYLTGQKPMILNSTNCKIISKVHGTAFIEDWAGKSITLHIQLIKCFGEDNVECLRVKKVAPQLPELLPNTDKWTEAITALKGVYTMPQIKKKYRISEDNEAKLLEHAAEGV